MAKGLTQQDLADKINKTRPLISHIEQTGNVNYNTLTEIGKVLNISLTDIENIVNEPQPEYKKAQHKTSDQREEIERLKEEITNLKELVRTQREMIELLKKGKGKKKKAN